MKAIIAAGGSGTRLRPLTFSSNKHLLPVANKPLILYPIEAIAATGIKEVGVIVNQTRNEVEDLLGNGNQWGLKISYIEQVKPLGLAHVVKISQSFLAGQPFVYHLGDNIFTKGIRKPFDHFTHTQPDALLTMVEHEENYRLGVPFFDKQGKLIKVVEKPSHPPNKFGVPGLYFFNQHVFEAFSGPGQIRPSPRGELEITELYSYLINHHYRVEVEEVEGRWMDPGKFTDMLEANRYLLGELQTRIIQGQVDTDSQINGVAVVGQNTRIVNSKIIGPVNIGDNCLVEDSVVGPNVAIAANCKIESSTISNSIVMQDSSLISIERIMTDCLIGKNTEIWEESAESVSLFIGDHCKVRLT